MEVETPVYTVRAHGLDTLETLPVPKGCIFITLALCGLPEKIVSDVSTKLSQDFSMNIPYLRDPLLNIKWLKARYGDVHIHCNQPGYDNTYTNIHYGYPFGFCKGTICNQEYVQRVNEGEDLIPGTPDCTCYSFLTGVYRLGDIAHNPPVDFLITPHTVTEDIYPIFNGAFIPDRTRISQAINYYQLRPDELEPETSMNPASILYNNLTTITNFAMIGCHTQRECFELYPGIYYHFTCRSSYVGMEPTTIGLRRDHSHLQNKQTNLTNNVITPDIINELIQQDHSYQTVLNIVNENRLTDEQKTYVMDAVRADGAPIPPQLTQKLTLANITPDKINTLIQEDHSYQSVLDLLRLNGLTYKQKEYIANAVIADMNGSTMENEITIELSNLLMGGKKRSKRKRSKRKSTRTRVNSFVRKRRFV